MIAPLSSSQRPQPSGGPSLRRILLTLLGGVSLAFCSYVAFFSFSGSGVVESVAAVTYAALFLTGVALFLGGCVQAIGFLHRKLKGTP
jgi:predicted phage tail protein